MEASIGGRWGATALIAFASLAVWQGLSSAWALQQSAAINAMNQTVLYAAAFALVLIGVRHVRDLTAMTWAALLGSGLVTAYALGSRLLPSLISGDDQPRLSAPISYWNGLGALVALGALLAIGMAGSPRCTRLARGAAAALLPMFLLALLLTFSRGAVAALLVGLAVLLALVPFRLETIAAGAASIAVSLPMLGIANADDSISAVSGVLAPHEDAGRRILLVLLITMLTSGAAAIGAGVGLSRLPQDRRGTAGVAMAACAAVALIALIAVHPPDGGPVSWSKQQFDSFRTFDAGARSQAESLSDRLAVAAGSGRWQNWSVATDQFMDAPVVGTGAGDYRFFWESEREIDLTVANAHSLYLETLGESGLIGLILLGTVIGVTALVAGRGTVRAPEPGSARAVGVAMAGASVIGVHAAGDWDWQLPTVMLPAIAIAAGALKIGAGRGPAMSSRARLAVSALAVTGIAFVIGPTMSAVVVERSRDAAAGGDLEQALSLARDAADLSPQDPAPRLLAANVLADLRRYRESDASFAAAVLRSPHDAAIFADWAVALQARGDADAARSAAERARRLNPLDPRSGYLLEGLRRGS